MQETEITCPKCGHVELGYAPGEPGHGATYVCSNHGCGVFVMFCDGWKAVEHDDLPELEKRVHNFTLFLYGYVYGCEYSGVRPDPAFVNGAIDALQDEEMKARFEMWRVPA